jgi:beta-galactosidase GanA
MGTPTAICPPWLYKKHPEVKGGDAGGIYSFGGRKGNCLSSAVFLRFAEKIVTEQAKALGDNPNIVGWQLDNEPGYPFVCYDPNCEQGFREWLKEKLYSYILIKYAKDKHFICTDPLIAMVIPKKLVNNPNVYIVHIKREANSFAQSFYKFSRMHWQSFVAHNFVPLWQIGIWPLENIFNKKIKKKYIKINKIKNKWFNNYFKEYLNYKYISFEEIFHSDNIKNIINKYFLVNISISKSQLEHKSNNT